MTLLKEILLYKSTTYFLKTRLLASSPQSPSSPAETLFMPVLCGFQDERVGSPKIQKNERWECVRCQVNFISRYHIISLIL
jgi:hypothetical protein